MTTTVLRGRRTHVRDREVAVFLIGLRVNRWWKVRHWWPSFVAFPRMMKALEEKPQGYLGGYLAWTRNGIMYVQYWNSVKELYSFASDSSTIHPKTWRGYFDRAKAAPGATGIWHETFVVQPGGTESVYDDMPLMGLAAATESIEVTPRGDTARQRLAGHR